MSRGLVASATLAVMVWLLLWTAPLVAQSSVTADLEVYVQDQTGAALTGADLVITHVATGITRHAQTDDHGRYRFTALPVGNYELDVKKSGFAAFEQRGITLQVGQTATLPVSLKVAAAQQETTVSAEAPLIEPEKTTVGGVVDSHEINNLPTNGRDFMSFSRTIAGVTPQQTSGQGSGLSFNGQRGRSNNILVDGVENNGQLNGNVRSTMSQDAVQQFQVVTDQYAAEFGNAGGGMVNVVSKSGANDLRGSAFYYARDAALDARNAFTPSDEYPPFTRKTVGATLGGPIVRNKTFFFASAEYTKMNQSDVTTISDANVAAINSELAIRPIPGSTVTSISNGVFPVGQVHTLASFKLDHHFDESNALSFRYLYGQDLESNSGGVSIGGLTDVSGGGGLHMRDNSFLADYVHIFSPSLLSDTRYQYAIQNMSQYDNDMIGPRVSISGVATWGRNTNFPVLLNENHNQFQHSFSWSHGRHFIKFGTDIDHIAAHTSFPVTFGGSFSFSGLTDFINGKANTFSQGFGDPDIHLPETMLAFYFQDSFRVTSRLTLNYGLRYDYDMQPQGFNRDPNNPIEAPLDTGIPRDGNNLSPRIGLAYALDHNANTVVRAGYGIFYDKIFLLVARNTLLARQSISMSGTAATAQFVNGAFPESNSYPTGVSLPKPSINLVPNNLVIPYMQQANLAIERGFGRNWHVAANYVFVHGVKLLNSLNTNLSAPTLLTSANGSSLGVSSPKAQQLGRWYYGSNARLNSTFNNIQEVGNWGGSDYNGLELSLDHRMSHGFSFRANYTFSKAIDNASDFTQAMQPDNPYNPRAERSLSNEDQRQRMTLTGVWELPYKRNSSNSSPLRWVLGDWVASSIWVFHSGTPDNITVGSDLNGDGNSSTDRPFINGVLVGRNAYMDPGAQTIDLRMEKRIPIRERFSVAFLAEAFNLFNKVNYNGVNLTWGTALTPNSSFGSYTSAGDPRQVQLGLKVSF